MCKIYCRKIISVIILSLIEINAYPRPYYDIIQHRMEIMYQNLTSFKVTYCEVRKINQTVSGLNFGMEIYDATRASEYWIKVDGQERLGMEHIYKKTGFTYEFHLCSILSGDVLKYNKAFDQFGRIPENCAQIKNETYYVKDFVFDERTPLPPETPGTHWKIDLTGYSKKDYGTIILNYYISIDRKSKRRMKKLKGWKLQLLKNTL